MSKLEAAIDRAIEDVEARIPEEERDAYIDIRDIWLKDRCEFLEFVNNGRNVVDSRHLRKMINHSSLEQLFFLDEEWSEEATRLIKIASGLYSVKESLKVFLGVFRAEKLQQLRNIRRLPEKLKDVLLD